MAKKRYKYFLKKKREGWYFQLMPNNSNTQAVAVSDAYASEEDARAGIRRFQEFMKNGYARDDVLVSECERKDGIGYTYEIVFSEEERLTSKKPYQKREIDNGLRRVEEHYEAPVKFNE